MTYIVPNCNKCIFRSYIYIKLCILEFKSINNVLISLTKVSLVFSIDLLNDLISKGCLIVTSILQIILKRKLWFYSCYRPFKARLDQIHPFRWAVAIQDWRLDRYLRLAFQIIRQFSFEERAQISFLTSGTSCYFTPCLNGLLLVVEQKHAIVVSWPILIPVNAYFLPICRWAVGGARLRSFVRKLVDFLAVLSSSISSSLF